MKEVRVRFAPSPTGALHIGGVRTALYNYLLARKHDGAMILRIEDTDQSRYVPGAEEYIMESLAWAGIKIDEGVREGGPYAPYRQSERKDIYRQYAQQLIESGHAYYAFDTEQELEAMRDRLKASGSDQQQYGSATRMQMRNSLTLPSAELRKLFDSGSTYVIRYKMPENETVSLSDLVRGEVNVHTSQLDDKVLMKSDGMPTYHLANVVDDYLMKISHVIRGEEWLPSAPLHVMLYRSFGWENDMPRFAHLPLLLRPEGNGKLSKRDADRMGFPIFPLNWTDPVSGELSRGYKESGYLPEALINFLALLGWNPGTGQEVFSMEDLIKAFEIDRIGKAGAKFDIHKAGWFNKHYLQHKPESDLAYLLKEQLDENQVKYDASKLSSAVELVRDRITFPEDLLKESKMLFQSPVLYDVEVSSKKWNDEAVEATSLLIVTFDSLNPFVAETIRETINSTLEGAGIKPGKVMQAIRLALTGAGSGPDLMKTFEILGVKESIHRLRHAIISIPQQMTGS